MENVESAISSWRVGSKKLGGRVKNFRTGGSPIWGGSTFAVRWVNTPLHVMAESCKKCVLKYFAKFWKNIHDGVFNLINFQSKGLQLYPKKTDKCAFLRILQIFQEHLFCKTLTDCYFQNIENQKSSTG